MAEPKLLEQDKDEWFYHSMNKYSNLYMFELEYPLDTLELINEESLCVSGVQEYSKKCELLQLCVPPKLLRSEGEEGLCKDRDFKILSGGYADGRVRQTKFLQQTNNLVAVTQDGYNGVVIYEVGNDDRATILEKHRLPIPSGTGSEVTGPLHSMKDRILLTSKHSTEEMAGIAVHEGKIDTYLKTHYLFGKSRDLKLGTIRKFREWDEHTCVFITTCGTICLYDLRTGSEMPQVYFHASKSPNLQPVQTPIIFSFDALPHQNKIGVIDSSGGYEAFDPRCIGIDKTSLSESAPTTTARSLLPDFAHFAGVYQDWFDIEYEDGTKMREEDDDTKGRFIISGVKKECVPVYQVATKQKVNESPEKQITSVFSHDGHCRPVTHAIWHPGSDNLIFSASLDAVLHAWQFIPVSQAN